MRPHRLVSTPLFLQYPPEVCERFWPRIPLQRRFVSRFCLDGAALVFISMPEPAMQLGVGRVVRHRGLEDRDYTGPVAPMLETKGPDECHDAPPAPLAPQEPPETCRTGSQGS